LDITEEYASKLRARLRSAIAGAERDRAPAAILDELRRSLAAFEQAPSEVQRAWSALDLLRRWRLGLVSR
jgi:hypothetical protein